MLDVVYYRGLVAELFRGRKLILALGPLTAMGAHVKLVRSLGAERPLLLCDGVGTGEAPSPDEADWVILESATGDMMGAIRAYSAALEALPEAALAAVERYDPDRTALVLTTFLVTATQIAGRPRFAPPAPAWRALEDKVVIDAFFERAGLPLAPWRVVPARLDALSAAAAALDEGAGTVWAGDAREGFNGGASYVRWVRDPAQAQEAASFYQEHCDRVRVMPFLEGIPCSIHGVVLHDTVMTLRPCEMLVLRRPGQARFQYCGMASTWDPPAADREALRDLARRVGAALREEVNYRGAFTIDGVMTAQGFRPTELNPRVGAALLMLGTVVPELPLWFLLQRMAQEDREDYRPEDLERLLLSAVDATRVARVHTLLPAPRQEQVEQAIVWEEAGYRAALPGETPHGKLVLGPSTAGSFLRLMADSAHLPSGPSFAPRAASAMRLADAIWGCGIGELIPAPDVRGFGDAR